MGFITGLMLIGVPMGFLLGVIKAWNQKIYLGIVTAIFAAALLVGLTSQSDVAFNVSEGIGTGLGSFIGHLLGEFAYNDAVN